MRVIMVESNVALRRQLESKLTGDPRIRFAGCFGGLTETFHEVEHRPPNLVLVGAAFPLVPEFDVMELLFQMLGVSWRVVANELQQSRLNALRGQRTPLSYFDPDAPTDALFRPQERSTLRPANPASMPSSRSLPAASCSTDRIILIGSSTGGVDALMKVLRRFPQDCPPTLIVQHIGAPFGEGLAGLLDRAVAPKVRLAEAREKLERGTVLLAPAARQHLVVDGRSGLSARLIDGEKVSGHRPSVDVLFQSAVPIAGRVAAAILTGMGSDGAEGITALRHAGAMTIGQDQETSLVYGMPGVAKAMGGVGRELPLNDIGAALLSARETRRVS